MSKALTIACLAVLLLTMLGCERRFHPMQGSARDLWIGIYTDEVDDKKCHIDFPTQNLSKKKHDQLRWYSADQQTYHVVFATASPGTPFKDHDQLKYTFDVPWTGEGVKSGEPISTADGYYPYGITNGKGLCKDPRSDDPGVNVKP